MDFSFALFLLLLSAFAFAWFFVAVWKTFVTLASKEPTLTIGGRAATIARTWIMWIFGVCVLFCLLPEINMGSREPARRVQCTNNLKQIALAMQNYESKHHCYPPAYTVGKDGRPLHTWRTLILPHLERSDIYKSLHLDEPWDSPHNRKVFDSAGPLPFFRCPSDSSAGPETNYVMIVGPKTISDGPYSIGLDELSKADGSTTTLLVVEAVGLGIPWYEPRDLQADQMSFRINDPDYFCISSRHSGMAHAAFCDGHTTRLADTADPKIIEALTTVNGQEEIPRFDEP